MTDDRRTPPPPTPTPLPLLPTSTRCPRWWKASACLAGPWPRSSRPGGGQHRPVHRALPQGAHRRPRRGPDPRDRGAPRVPRGARGPPRRDPRVGGRAGQADARARGQAPRPPPRKAELEDLYARTGRAARRAPRSRARRASSRSPSASSRRPARAIRPPRRTAFVDCRGGRARRRGARRARATSSPSRSPTPPRCAPTCAREYGEHGELRRPWCRGKGRRADEVRAVLPVLRGRADDPVAPLPRDPAAARPRACCARRRRRRDEASAPRIERLAKLDRGSPWAREQLRLATADALKRLLAPSIENDVRAELKLRSDGAAVEIFAEQPAQPPARRAARLARAVIGVDPGLRTGCKCAAVDATGKFLGTVTVYITQGDAQSRRARRTSSRSSRSSRPRAIAVGNGTGGEARGLVKKRSRASRRGAGGEGGEGGWPTPPHPSRSWCR